MYEPRYEEFKGVCVWVATQANMWKFVDFQNHYDQILETHTAFPCMEENEEDEEYDGNIVFFIDEHRGRVFFLPEDEEESFRENGNFDGFKKTNLETALKGVVEREFRIGFRK